jgi:hypothetical protein
LPSPEVVSGGFRGKRKGAGSNRYFFLLYFFDLAVNPQE